MLARGRSLRQPPLLLLLLIFFFVLIHAHGESYANVVTNQFMGLNPRSGSRFLAYKASGTCNLGVNPCTDPKLMCCKNICVDLSSDNTNCGACGMQCPFGQLCCSSVCTAIAYDTSNCGGCGTRCKSGTNCLYGVCGYAA